jgi:hypothetical protein
MHYTYACTNMHTYTSDTLFELHNQVEELRKNSGKGEHAALLAALKQMESGKPGDDRAKRMNMIGSKKPDQCAKCKELQASVHKLESDLRQSRDEIAVLQRRPNTNQTKELVKSTEEVGESKLAEAHAMIESLTEKENTLKIENARLKRRLAEVGKEGMVGRDAAEQDMDMLTLAEHAASMDAHAQSIEEISRQRHGADRPAHRPARADSRGGDGDRVTFSAGASGGDLQVQQTGSPHDGVAEVLQVGTLADILDSYGLTEQSLMDIMEKVEGLEGGKHG